MREGWKKLQLGQVCKRICVAYVGPTTKYYTSKGAIFLRTKNVTSSGLDLREIKYIKNDFHQSLKKSSLHGGEILVTRVITDEIKCAIVPFGLGSANCGNVVIIKPGHNISSEFLKYYIQSPDSQKYLLSKKVGSAQLVVNTKVVQSWPIKMPVLQEQKQIVSILDKAFAAIDKAKTNIEKNIQNAEELFQSKLNAVFSQKGEGSANGADKWEETILEKEFAIIGGGTPSKKNESYYNGNIPWATVRDMNNDWILNTDHSITEVGLKNSSSNVIPSNNVVIATRVGLGKVCMLKNDTAINQDLKGIIPKNENSHDNEFLFWWFKSIAGKVINAGTGATVQGVKLPFIKSLKYPKLKVQDQTKIVDLVKRLDMNCELVIKTYKLKLDSLIELKKSSLQKAFSGELTSSDTIIEQIEATA